MKTEAPLHPSFEFYLPDADLLLLVESSGDEVVVRVTKDTFSDRRKVHFLRHLAAEGFIPDRYQWLCELSTPCSRIQWVVDSTWVKMHPAVLARSRQFMVRFFLSAGLLWLGLIAGMTLFHTFK